MSRFYIFIIAFALCSSAGAQRAKTVRHAVRKSAQPTVVEDPRLEQMRMSTQKIIFIDSVVVNKRDILNALNLTRDAGTISAYSDFFKTADDGDSFVFLNEIGNKCVYSKEEKSEASAIKELYVSDFIGRQWTDTRKVTGLCDEGEMTHKNYPFVMSDGITLYFSAQGDESIGGWDIFVTRYDAEENTFLKAENIGMPFNSPANDYFYIVDDINNIGWFASDRNQPEGKVCVYTFIPSDARQNYDTDSMDEEKLQSLSSLYSIKDTWGNGSERDKALQRLDAARKSGAASAGGVFTLVVNDDLVYTDYSQFRDKGNVAKMKAVAEAEKKLSQLTATLEKARAFYPTANAADKEILANEIVDNEQQVEELRKLIVTQKKEIRNTENLRLKR